MIWTLLQSNDLNANLVRFEAGGGVRGSCQTGMSSASSGTSFHAVQVREKQGHGPSTPPAPPSHHSQKGRAGSEQEPEVVPVPAPCLIVERELLPPTENVHDEDDPGRKTVPNAPKQVCPPHDVYLLYDRRSLTSSETSRPSRKSLLAVRSARRPTARGPTTVRRSGRATFSSPRAYLLDAGSAFDCMVQRASFPEQAWAFG